MRPLLSIQYLRALAVLLVVAFHACQWVRVDFEVGAAGVDLFFIVSGFILWAITEQDPPTPAVFLKRRAARVVPLYWLATLVATAVCLIHPGAIPSVTPTWSHVILSMLFVPHDQPGLGPFPLIPIGWTLNYEAAFYLVFALGLAMEAKGRFLLVTLTFAGLVLWGVAYPPVYRLLGNLLLWEFVGGMALARLWRAGRLPNRWVGWGLFGLGLVLLLGQRITGDQPDLWRPLWWGIPCWMIACGLVSVEADGGLPRLPPLKTIGDASYAIYLTHTLVAPAFVWAFALANPWGFIPIDAALGVICGLLVWRFVETPLLRLTRRWAG